MENGTMNERFDKYIDKVERFYSKNKEHYHTIHHIHRMFEVYEKFEEQFDKEFEYDKDDLFWSIAFHDAYYLVGYEHNEYISGEIAMKELREIKDNESLFKIKKTIWMTEVDQNDTNFSKLKTPEEKIIHDLDWSGFFDYYHLLKNEEKIFQEANDTGNFYWRDVRKNQFNFYKMFSKSNLYLTNAMKDLNKVARENISSRINDFRISFSF